MELLLNMTIGGTVTACLILLIKRVFRNKLTPKWHLYLWLILAIRLVLPIFPESSFSLLNAVPTAQNITTVQSTIGQNEASDSVESTDSVQSGYMKGNLRMLSPVTGETLRRSFSVPEQQVNLLLAGWFGGAVLMGGGLMGAYWAFQRRAKKLPECRDTETLKLLKECGVQAGVRSDNVKLRSGGSTPMLQGLFRPTILIPDGYSGEELRHVLIHELCHYKHRDILINMICSAFLCIYWFNPVLWICFCSIRRDLEFLCDERVIEITGERKEYSRTLLKTALKKNHFLFATTSMQNGEKEVTKRIKHIAGLKKPKVWISIVAALIVLMVGALCLTDASGRSTGGEITDPQSYQPETPYRSDWTSTADKLLNQYFKNYVHADLPASSAIRGYRIDDIMIYGDREASWSVIYSDVMVMEVDYTLQIASPEQYSFSGSGFEIGEDRKTQIYQNRLAVFRLDPFANAKFLAFVTDEDIRILGEDAAVLHTISFTDPNQSPEALLKLKMPYIGDHTRVGRILGSLPLSQFSTGLELHTKSEPYGLTVNYDMTGLGNKVFESRPDKAMTDSGGWDPNPYLMARLYKNSMILLALIDNCSTVEFRITGISEYGVPYTYHYFNDREKAAYDLSQDPRSFTESLDAFTGLMNHLESIHMMRN